MEKVEWRRMPHARDITYVCVGFLEVRILRQYEAAGYRIVSVVGLLNGDKILYLSRD